MFLTDYDKETLKGFEQTEFARVFYMVLDAEIAQDRELLEDNPKICDDNLKKDFRCKTGEIRGLKRARNLVRTLVYQEGVQSP